MERREEMIEPAILKDKGQKNTIMEVGKKRRLLLVEHDRAIQENFFTAWRSSRTLTAFF
jgi:hypothetical protein